MLEIMLFGPTTVVLADGTRLSASELGGAKSRQILEILALTPGMPVAKEQLAEMLWNGRPPRTYLATVESYVCVLRRTLRMERGRTSALATTSRGYLLRADQVRVDLVEARRILRTAAGAPTDVGQVEQAAHAASLPLLISDHGADWVVAERARLERDLVEGCSRAAASALDRGDAEVAMRLAGTAVRQDPMAEDAVRTLMLAQGAAGLRADALRAYATLREVLGEELGLEPAAATHDIYLQVLRTDGSRPGPDHRAEASREVRALLELLRQVLESVPGLDVPRSDRGLAEAAGLLADAARAGSQGSHKAHRRRWSRDADLRRRFDASRRSHELDATRPSEGRHRCRGCRVAALGAACLHQGPRADGDQPDAQAVHAAVPSAPGGQPQRVRGGVLPRRAAPQLPGS